MDRYRMFFVETSTLPPSMHQTSPNMEDVLCKKKPTSVKDNFIALDLLTRDFEWSTTFHLFLKIQT